MSDQDWMRLVPVAGATDCDTHLDTPGLPVDDDRLLLANAGPADRWDRSCDAFPDVGALGPVRMPHVASGSRSIDAAGEAVGELPRPSRHEVVDADSGVRTAAPVAGGPDRRIGQLHPELRPLIKEAQDRLDARDHRMVLIEGLRSAARQDQLNAEGPHRSNRDHTTGLHCLGRAIDVAFVIDGRIEVAPKDRNTAARLKAAYAALGEVVDEINAEHGAPVLRWGGRFPHPDSGHLELRQAVDTRWRPPSTRRR